jgi:microcompartment protein CcmK/EutM
MFVEYDSRGRDPKSLYVAFKSVKASTLYQSQVSRGSDTRPSFGAVEVGEELCVTGYWKHMETHGNTHLTETVQSHHVLEKDGKGPISLVVDVVDGRCG